MIRTILRLAFFAVLAVLFIGSFNGTISGFWIGWFAGLVTGWAYWYAQGWNDHVNQVETTTIQGAQDRARKERRGLFG